MPTIKLHVTQHIGHIATLRYEARFLVDGKKLLATIPGKPIGDGTFAVTFGKELFEQAGANNFIDVQFAAFRGDQELKVGGHIERLELRDYDVKLAVDVPPESFVVRGTITDAAGHPAVGLTVRALDRDMRAEQVLGEAVTDHAGRYEVWYTTEQFRRAEKTHADLRIRVFDKNANDLGTSNTVFAARPDQTIDLVLAGDRYRGTSEYERYHAELAPLIENVPVAELNADDISFLVEETGIVRDHLSWLRLAAEYAAKHELDAPVFYGLFRKGLPTEYRRLLAERPSRIAAALKAAIADNIIPFALGEKLDTVLARLEALAIKAATEHEDPEAPAPIGALLATSSLTQDQTSKLVRFSLEYRGAADTFWKDAQQNLGFDDTALAEARFALEAGAIVRQHAPTLAALQQYRRAHKWTEARDLARLSRDGWRELVKNATVDGVPAGFADADAFAEAIAHSIEQQMPTAVLAHELANDANASGDLATFLARNTSFDIVHTHVDEFLANGADLTGVKDPAKLREDAKQMQRLVRIAPRQRFYETVKGLQAAGYTSAVSVTSGGERAFYAKTEHVLDPEIAKTVYETARIRTDVTTIIHQRARDFLEAPGPMLPGRIPTPDPGDEERPPWAAMFGGATCACGHCRSVLSPAAYLADLLKFIDDAPNGDALLAALRARRPDIEHIVLDCNNANTPLPYIDLVNEILGDVVAGGVPTARQTEGDEAALRAEPAPGTENTAAFDRLATAVFPWHLPFDRGHEEVRLLGEHLALDLAALWQLFDRDAGSLTRARLGLDARVYDLLTASSVPDTTVAALWGGATLAALTEVPVFLERSGLSYQELEALTASSFLSASGAGEVRLERGDDPCDLATHRLVGLSWPVLDQIQRFVRTTRHLGWPIEMDNIPLATVLAALGHRTIDASSLADLARARRVATAVHRTVAELVTLDATRLASVLGTTTAELSLFLQLLGETEPLTPAACVRTVEAWLELRSSGFEVRELAYILAGWDQTPAAFAPPDTELDTFLGALHELVHPAASASSTPRELADTIIDNVARYLALQAASLRPLLCPTTDEDGTAIATALLHAVDDPARPAIDDIVAWAQAARTAGDPADQRVRQLLLALHRIGKLVSRLGLGERELVTIAQLPATSGMLDFNLLVVPPIAPPGPDPQATTKRAGWSALVEAAQLRLRLPRGDQDLFDLLRRAVTDGHDPAVLAAATGWDADALASLTTSLGLGAGDFAVPRTYARLAQAMTWIARYRISANELARWAHPSTTSAELATGLRTVARARLATDSAWYAVRTPIMDVLRERTRDALVAHVIHHQRTATGERRFADTNDVYAHYLIDVEMSSCQVTSRIVQACAAIQLFVQRLLMNLEQVRLTDADREYWRQWEWRKNYRVWEANRKVFLYPENWIEPELRDDKSPLFRELENTLLQGELTDEAVERACRTYLAKLDDIARLDIRGHYHETDRDVLHLFARTHASPHAYYYRRRLATRVWTPWERVDMEIDSDHILPVVHEGRLLLFWAIFEEERRSASTGDSDDPERYWRISMAWSEYRDGHWMARQLATNPPLLTKLARKSDFTFKVYVEDGQLFIRTYTKHSALGGMIGSIMTLRFDTCARKLVNASSSETRMYLPPAGTELAGMSFVENPERSADELSAMWGLGDDTIGLSETVRELLDEGGLGGVLLAIFLAAIDVGDQWQTFVRSADRIPLLDHTPGTFSLTPAHQLRQFTGLTPFVAEVEARSYLVSPRMVRRALGALELEFPEYRFEPLYHPFSCEMTAVTSRANLAALFLGSEEMSPPWPARQQVRERRPVFARFGPSPYVAQPRPIEQISFDRTDAYGLYNWELFFHIPLLVASRLSQSRQFAEAQRWFHYIFDPTDVSDRPAPAKYWKVKPLYEEALDPPRTIDDLLRRLAAGWGDEIEPQITTWQRDPFNPHAIARLRTLAYMRAVVFKYLDNLIAWGDDLFAQGTRESINEAAQVYVRAAEILGKQPPVITRPDTGALDFATLRSQLDAFANALVELESALPAELPSDSGGSDGARPPEFLLYFCIPANAKLAGYRDTIADRLFKIRNCRDLDGQRMELPLFAPPIDPALLVRARAAGLDLRDALRETTGVAVPQHRYPVLFQKALELAGDLRAFEGALLSALEKRDAEELALLRSRHEGQLLEQLRAGKLQRIAEANEALASLAVAKQMAVERQRYYRSREFINAAEASQLFNLAAAHVFESIGQGFNAAASTAHMFPDAKIGAPTTAGTTFGGTNIGHSLRAFAGVFSAIASQHSFAATMSSIIGGYQRRQEEWEHQAALATLEIQQLEKQIVAAEIRKAIAEHELMTHDLQVAQSREVESFLREKFTNTELYGWMAAQLAALHHEAYRMAYSVAKQAEQAARHQLGVSNGEFAYISFGHWEGPRRGLLAAERLHQELRRMDIAFLEQHRREYEITKHVSLALVDPGELIRLREHGSCTITIPETLFDLDFPGQYRRRLRSVSVTIPCVVGPYTSVSAKLSLLASQVRWTPDLDTPPQPVMGTWHPIVTSTATADSGVFELNLRDERLLPFEGAGAVSTWLLELPDTFRAFDYDTISDVVMHLRYTAVDDPALKVAVTQRLAEARDAWLSTSPAITRGVSLRQEFAPELHRFLHPAGSADEHSVDLVLDARHFPHFLRDHLHSNRVDLREATVIIKPRVRTDAVHFEGQPVEVTVPGSSTSAAAPLVIGPAGLPLRAMAGLSGTPVGRWTIRMTPTDAWPPELTVRNADGRVRINPDAIEDIYLLVRYQVGALTPPS